jgi:arginine:pyruvate transaminase
MKPSNRISSITNGGSDGWEIFYKARQMVSSEIDVIELSIGEHDIGTDPAILKSMNKAALNGHTGYALVPGLEDLRSLVANRTEKKTGIRTTLENVIITPGGQSALFAAHMAVLDQGETAAYIDPFYATYPTTIRSVGAIEKRIITSAENYFQPTFEQLDSATKKTKSLLINSPNNPTGMVYNEATIKSICDVAKKNNLWIISDEVYSTQIWAGKHISPREIENMTERTLVVGSLSKSHAMTGSRLGWLLGPKEIIAKAIDLATNMTYGVPGFIQHAGIFALEQGKEFEEKISRPFNRRQKLALDILKDFPNLNHIPPQGGMYVMLNIRTTGMSGITFAHKLLDIEKIAVMPGESFGKAASGHIRISLTLEDKKFEETFRRICKFASHLSVL